MSQGHAQLKKLIALHGSRALARRVGVSESSLRTIALGGNPKAATRDKLAKGAGIAVEAWDHDGSQILGVVADNPENFQGLQVLGPVLVLEPGQGPGLPPHVTEGLKPFAGSPDLTRAYAEARAVLFSAADTRDRVRGCAGVLAALRAALRASPPGAAHPATTVGWPAFRDAVLSSLRAADLATDLVEAFDDVTDPWPYEIALAAEELVNECKRLLEDELGDRDRVTLAGVLSGAGSVLTKANAVGHGANEHPAWVQFKEDLVALCSRDPARHKIYNVAFRATATAQGRLLPPLPTPETTNPFYSALHAGEYFNRTYNRWMRYDHKEIEPWNSRRPESSHGGASVV